MSVEVDDGDDGAVGAHVGDEHDEGVVEREKRGATTTWAADYPTFGDPPLFQKLLGDGGDGTGLQAGELREIGTRYRLLGPDEFEDDVAIDVACDLA